MGLQAQAGFANGAVEVSHEGGLARACFLLTFGSAVSILFSIALSQTLLGLALALKIAARVPIRLPAIKLPLALFFLLTVCSVVLSPDPVRGLPQLRKFYVFAMLPMVFSNFATLGQVRALVLAWTGVAFLSAIDGVFQYVHRYHMALEQYAYDYGFFLDGRVKGFAGHWMTFGGEQMVVLLMCTSLLCFSAQRRWRWFAFLCAPVVWVSIVLGLTRSIFLLGMPIGMLYLFWHWKRWLVWLAPALVVLELFAGPVQVRERVASVVQPHRELDSNAHRTITRRTGWAMVKAHPWFGLGPEQVGPQFLRYAPPDIPRPLPKGYYGHLHNIYLQYAAERGIPALLAMMWLIGRAIRDFRRGAKWLSANTEACFVLHGAVAVILAVLAEGFFEYNLGDSEVLTLFLTLVACGYLTLELAGPKYTSEASVKEIRREYTMTALSQADASWTDCKICVISWAIAGG